MSMKPSFLAERYDPSAFWATKVILMLQDSQTLRL
jgi:hypothetical protein